MSLEKRLDYRGSLFNDEKKKDRVQNQIVMNKRSSRTIIKSNKSKFKKINKLNNQIYFPQERRIYLLENELSKYVSSFSNGVIETARFLFSKILKKNIRLPKVKELVATVVYESTKVQQNNINLESFIKITNNKLTKKKYFAQKRFLKKNKILDNLNYPTISISEFIPWGKLEQELRFEHNKSIYFNELLKTIVGTKKVSKSEINQIMSAIIYSTYIKSINKLSKVFDKTPSTIIRWNKKFLNKNYIKKLIYYSKQAIHNDVNFDEFSENIKCIKNTNFNNQEELKQEIINSFSKKNKIIYNELYSDLNVDSIEFKDEIEKVINKMKKNNEIIQNDLFLELSPLDVTSLVVEESIEDTIFEDNEELIVDTFNCQDEKILIEEYKLFKEKNPQICSRDKLFSFLFKGKYVKLDNKDLLEATILTNINYDSAMMYSFMKREKNYTLIYRKKEISNNIVISQFGFTGAFFYEPNEEKKIDEIVFNKLVELKSDTGLIGLKKTFISEPIFGKPVRFGIRVREETKFEFFLKEKNYFKKWYNTKLKTFEKHKTSSLKKSRYLDAKLMEELTTFLKQYKNLIF